MYVADQYVSSISDEHRDSQLSIVTNETLSIIGNKEIIAINQDNVVGTAISPFRWGINVRPRFVLPFSFAKHGINIYIARLDLQFITPGSILEWRE